MRLHEARRDHYRRLAQRRGYRSRSVYKLLQIAERHHLLREGLLVLDFGCAPGSWLQLASQRVGPRGQVIGFDLVKIPPVAANVKTFVADILDPAFPLLLQRILPRPADLILSDASPKASGIPSLDQARQLALAEAAAHLFPSFLAGGGSAVLKVFEGPDTPRFEERLRHLFRAVARERPAATRSESRELYLVCKALLGARQS